MELEHHQSCIPRELSLCKHLTAQKPHSQDLSLLDLTQSRSVQAVLVPGYLSKTISSSCLISQLPESALPVGVDNRLTKNLKGKTEEWNICKGH